MINLQRIKDIGVICGDLNKISDKCVKNFCQKIDILDNLDAFPWILK